MSKFADKKNKLEAERAATQETVDSLLLKDGYTREDQSKVDECLAKLDAIAGQLASMAKAEADKEVEDIEPEAEQENSFRHAPAVIRSRGRVSSNDTIQEHAKRENYSIARAISGVLNGRLTGVEAEADQELGRTQARRGSFLAPMGNMDKLNKRTDLTLTSGTGAIPVYWDAQQFVDFLQPVMVGPKLGVKYVNGLDGVTKWPRRTNALTVSAVAEQSGAAASAPALDDVVLTPHSVTANCTISRKFQMQSVLPWDRYVLDSLAMDIGTKLYNFIFNGTGASNQPTGILNNSDVANVVTSTSNALSYANILAMEAYVAEGNAYFGNLGYVTSPSGYAKLQGTPKIGSTYPIYLINENGELNGNPVVRSAQIPKNITFTGMPNLTAIIFGAWQFCVAATFGSGLDILVNPYTGDTTGDVRITGFIDFDTTVEHGAAFSYCSNILP